MDWGGQKREGPTARGGCAAATSRDGLQLRAGGLLSAAAPSPESCPWFSWSRLEGKKVEDPQGVILVFRTAPPSYPVFTVCPPSFPAVPVPPIPCQAVLAPVGWGRLGRHPEFAAIPDSLTSLRELELGED